MIDTKLMRYTANALESFRAGDPCKNEHRCGFCRPIRNLPAGTARNTCKQVSGCLDDGPSTFASRQSIGDYSLTSKLAPWVHDAMATFQPEDRVQELVKPYAAKLHMVIQEEQARSSGLHDLGLIEQAYQFTLHVAATVLLSADEAGADDSTHVLDGAHSSKAGGDEEFAPWGRLLTGLECNPPIISLFPFYLMMCQAFTFEKTSDQEQYVYAALTGIDWAKANGTFNERLGSFAELVHRAVPKLQDEVSGQDRSFWRIAHAYLGAINACENSRAFRTPRCAAVAHALDLDIIMAMRGLDTIGSAFMGSDGAAWLDNDGFGSLIGSALPNDVMDLDTDIRTGESRNLLRLLYPGGLSVEQTAKIASTILSGFLCEMYRGHRRARFDNREDGRIVATSPPYSFCRAQHRRIFETLEMYVNKYPNFWTWTDGIYQMAKRQITEAGFKEPLACALKRAGKAGMDLPHSPATSFYDSYYDLIEAREPLPPRRPLGVGLNLSNVICRIHTLWNIDLRAAKEPGWGRELDIESDRLFGQAGRILSQSTNASGKYEFAIAYGRLCTTLPYISYHTIAAIIMAYGIVEGGGVPRLA